MHAPKLFSYEIKVLSWRPYCASVPVVWAFCGLRRSPQRRCAEPIPVKCEYRNSEYGNSYEFSGGDKLPYDLLCQFRAEHASDTDTIGRQQLFFFGVEWRVFGVGHLHS